MYKIIQNDPEFLKSVLLSSTATAAAPFHVIFDCDGLLLDTEPIYSQVALQAIRHFSKQQTGAAAQFPNELKNKVMGGTKEQVAQKMVEHVNTSIGSTEITSQDWINYTETLELEQFSLGCPLMPAVLEAVNFFVKKLKWPAAVATSTDRKTFNIKAARHRELFASFGNITCGDDPDETGAVRVKGKPDPSIFRTARHHLNRKASEPGVVLEDSPNGVVAALRSGHCCIWIPSAANLLESSSTLQSILKEFDAVFNENLWIYLAPSLEHLLKALNS